MARDQVFICYAHADKPFLDEFQTMLAPLVNAGAITAWDDTKIQAGANWRDEIDRALANAKVGVLLVSPDFLASDFIIKEELPVLHAAAERGELTLIWIAIRPSLYEATVLAKYQAVNDPSKPLSGLSKKAREEELVSICKQIQVSIDVSLTISSSSTASSPQPPATAPSAGTTDRLDLVQKLSALASGQFNMIVFAVNPPPGIVPGMPAPQADRAFALLSWAESPGGCGLDVVKQAFDQVTNP